MLKTMIGKIN